MNTELARRFASGLPLAIVAAVALAIGPLWLVYAIILGFCCIAGWEWGQMTGKGGIYGIGGVAIAMALALLLVNIAPWVRTTLLLLSGLLWLGIALRIYRVERRGQLPARPPSIVNFPLGLCAIALAAVGADTLLQTQPSTLDLQFYYPNFDFSLLPDPDGLLGRLALIAVLTATAFADIGAYAFGKLWGHRRISPVVSPGKTVEGMFGGFIAVFGFMALLMPLLPEHWLFLLLLGATVVIVGLIGDLWVSLRKRHSGVKDSGKLFAGHGGALDRLDSHLAALPISAAFVHLLAESRATLMPARDLVAAL